MADALPRAPLSAPLSPDLLPVIIAIGEVTERPDNLASASEPIALMAQAFQLAGEDSGLGHGLLSRITRLDLVGQTTWRYRNPVSSLCERLGIAPEQQVNASMGGETPVRLLHEAAARIASGETGIYAVVGGEALNALNKARKAGVTLPWTDLVSADEAVKVDFSELPLSKAARRAGVRDPAHVYPFYETARIAARGLRPADARLANAQLWARYGAVAASNPYSWIRTEPAVEAITGISDDNRMVAYPYSKLMVANPSVNQAACFVVTSVATARALGIADDRMVHIHGGAAAEERDDFLARSSLSHSPAQRAALSAALSVTGIGAGELDMVELYSCFPIVPTLALEQLTALGLRDDIAPTVTGGLTFFGGPFNNHMGHAITAMTRHLRSGAKGEIGMLYGQGGVMSKHHAVILGRSPGNGPVQSAASAGAQTMADSEMGPAPQILDRYAGPARIEAFTIQYGPTGKPVQGIVILRNDQDARIIARTLPEDEATLALLTSPDKSAVGATGIVRTDVYDTLVFEEGTGADRRDRPYRHCRVERDGHLTVVVIDRPDRMNALNPAANEELTEIFDDFQRDPDQWVAILTGNGRAFCTGNDLKEMNQRLRDGLPLNPPARGFAGLTARWNLEKPVIAAVNGAALGGGFEIALACDLIIASENASFALPEPKVGLAALAGGLHRLPRQIGQKAAMGLILTGRTVNAAEGRELGFVNEVTSPDELMPVARRWADQILGCSPMAVRASKAVVTASLDQAILADAFDGQNRNPAVRSLFRSHDFREGPRAFAEKRPPRWRGE